MSKDAIERKKFEFEICKDAYDEELERSQKIQRKAAVHITVLSFLFTFVGVMLRMSIDYLFENFTYTSAALLLCFAWIFFILIRGLFIILPAAGSLKKLYKLSPKETAFQGDLTYEDLLSKFSNAYRGALESNIKANDETNDRLRRSIDYVLHAIRSVVLLLVVVLIHYCLNPPTR